MSQDKIVRPSFTYTNNPPPIPFLVSFLSTLKSLLRTYPFNDKFAFDVEELHHDSVTKIKSGLDSLAINCNSLILLKIL